MLDRERMAQIDRLFERVIDVEPGQAEAILARHAEHDPDLVREVRALMDGEQGAAEISLPCEPARWAARATGAGTDEEVGSRVGAYRLLRPLGRGGMGVVWLAERADGAFEQRVALKVLPPGYLTAAARRRFERERQILANLSHDNIARLLDGGVDTRGRPFLAMELVEGRPITDFCDGRRLPLGDRVRLMAAAARAVQAAHRNRIVHCDLKPANILVTDQGVVKLLDFGIAELLGAERDDDNGPFEIRRVTPEYASPESLGGGALTTTADVFQLGLLLRELACGRRRRGRDADGNTVPPSAAVSEPDANGLPPVEIAARRRTTPRRLRRALAGDLDAIVRRATARDPGRRYQSAESLARDLDRFLRGRPVEAREAGWPYRVGKLVRRHPAISSLAAALLVVAAGLVWQSDVARRERDRAEAEAATARSLAARTQEVSDFLVSMLTDASLEDIRDDLTVVELLDQGRRRVQDELPPESEARAELEEILGRVYLSLGRPNDALTLLRDAVERRRQDAGTSSDELVDSVLDLGRVYIELGRHDDSRRWLEEGLELQCDADGGVLVTPGRAEILTLLSYVHGMLGELEPMLAMRRESLAIRESVYGPDHLETAQGLNDLCFAYKDIGEYQRAERLCRRALEIRVAAGGTAMGSLNNLAWVEIGLGRLDDAEAHSRQALAAALERYPREHPSYGRYLVTLGVVLLEQGRPEDAADTFAEARAIFAASRPAGHRDLAWIDVLTARPELQIGDPVRAEGRVRDALAILRRDHGENQHLVLQARLVLAETLLAQGRRDEARRILDDVERRLRPGRSDGELWLRRARELLAGLGET